MTALLERHTGTPAPAADPRTASPDRGVRMEIQALRALAVGLVVVYHVAPLRLPGGFVGVDVFFVVSGFLITGHLMREAERTGRIRLAQFWARRARRLLPAALLVILGSAVATFLFVPMTLWQQFLHEQAASALYIENWLLAADAVDYLAAHNQASPTQHYWSLSTEEQFYLAWPLLILGTGWLAVRLGGRQRHVTAAVLLLVTAASFGYSLWATGHDTPAAYFTAPARSWEFGAGALLAVVAASPPAGRDALRRVVSWAGFAAITWAAFRFDATTPFPGTAALLPVLGTVAVIWAGTPRGDWAPTKLAEFGPVRLLGDLSYSAYLWHWPVIVILPFALGHPLGTVSKAGVLVGTVVAAWATKVLVEDPVRTGTFLSRRPVRATYALTALATAAVLAVTTLGSQYVDAEVDRARATAADLVGTACFGADAMNPASGCLAPFRATATTNPVFAKNDRSTGMNCLVKGLSTDLRACTHGSPGATRSVALIGDSVAASWWEAVTGMADEQGVSARMHVHTGCPALATDRFTGPNMHPGLPAACATWSRQVIATLAADPAVTTVFTTYRSDTYKYRAPDGALLNRWPADVVRSALQPLLDAGKEVVVLRAVPTTNGVTPDGKVGLREVKMPDCIAASRTEDDPCAGPRAVRVVTDSIAEGVRGLPGARVVDLTDLFCDPARCHGVIGGVIVYFDGSHLTGTFSRSLAPFLSQAWEDGRGGTSAA